MPRLHVLVNPSSGRRRAAWAVERVRSALESGGLQLVVHAGHRPGACRTAARDVPLSEGDLLLVAGGDGTLMEVVDGLFARPDACRPPVGLLPVGTGNALARDLGLRDAAAGARALLAGRRRTIDVVRLHLDGTRRHALGILGWGLAASAGRRAEHLRRLGPIRYALGAVWAVLADRPARPPAVTLDGETHDAPLAMLFAANTATTGAGMVLAAGARLDDGLLDVLLVPRMPRLSLLRLLARVQRGRPLDGAVPVRRVRALSLRSGEPMLLNVDGELLTARHVEAEVLPRALTLLA